MLNAFLQALASSIHSTATHFHSADPTRDYGNDGDGDGDGDGHRDVYGIHEKNRRRDIDSTGEFK